LEGLAVQFGIGRLTRRSVFCAESVRVNRSVGNGEPVVDCKSTRELPKVRRFYGANVRDMYVECHVDSSSSRLEKHKLLKSSRANTHEVFGGLEGGPS
jgi:hypothetical protein